jgi:hypothetical protein
VIEDLKDKVVQQVRWSAIEMKVSAAGRIFVPTALALPLWTHGAEVGRTRRSRPRVEEASLKKCAKSVDKQLKFGSYRSALHP